MVGRYGATDRGKLIDLRPGGYYYMPILSHHIACGRSPRFVRRMSHYGALTSLFVAPTVPSAYNDRGVNTPQPLLAISLFPTYLRTGKGPEWESECVGEVGVG